jgi:hypothetical protein
MFSETHFKTTLLVKEWPSTLLHVNGGLPVLALLAFAVVG